jgi:dolichyl-phosphate beta-glucosyltransferase
VGLVVPCYNEEHRFDPERFIEALDRFPRLSLFLVDDGSRDHTLERLRSVASGYSDRVSVIVLSANRGKAEAVRSGVLEAIERGSQEYVGFWDVDCAVPLTDLPMFFDFAAFRRRQPPFGVLMASRVQLLGADIRRNRVRHYLGRIFATIVSQWVLRLSVYDTQCGAKLFRSDLAQELFAEPFVSRWFFDVELLARLVGLHGREVALRELLEVPIPNWIDVRGSKLRLRDFLRTPLELWKIHRHYRHPPTTPS